MLGVEETKVGQAAVIRTDDYYFLLLCPFVKYT